MYPIISYTFHLSVCFSLGILLWFYKEESKFSGSNYRAYLQSVALLFLFNIPEDILLLYLQVCGIDESAMYVFVTPFFAFLTSGLLLRPFLLNLHSNIKNVRLQDMMSLVLLLIGLFHPILYYQFQVRHHYDYSFDILSYQEFLLTPESQMLTLILYVVGILYILLCIVNVVLHIRTFYLWSKHKNDRKIFTLSLRNFFIPMFVFVLMVIDSVVYGFVGDNYCGDLPLWAALDVVLTVFVLNTKRNYLRLEKEAIQLQMDFVGARLFNRKPATGLDGDEVVHHREKTAVLHAIQEWSARDDRPYRNENLTIASLSEDVGIPGTIIVRYINSAYGLSFDEYIQYLNTNSNTEKESI